MRETLAADDGSERDDDGIPGEIRDVRKRLAEVLSVQRELREEVAACMRIIDRLTRAAVEQ